MARFGASTVISGQRGAVLVVTLLGHMAWGQAALLFVHMLLRLTFSSLLMSDVHMV